MELPEMLAWGFGAVTAVGSLVKMFEWADRQAERAQEDTKDARANQTARMAAAYATVGRSQLPSATHFSPTYHIQQLPGPERAPLAPPSITEAPPLALPGVTDLGAVLGTGWRPSAQSILLGLGPGGVPITVPAGDMLCHVAFGGKTGAGKTNLMRLFLTQLCAAGAEVYLCDPHYAPVNPRTQEDWRPIAARLQGGGPLVDKDAIVALMDGTAAELDRRLARWHAGADPGPARFYAIEELPLLAAHDKEFMPKLGRLLREGRKLGLYVIMASQDLLISTLGGSSGLRAQFQTLYYGGGDDTTRKVMVGYRTPEPPGRGVVYLRSAVQQEPQLVRVPLVTNADIAALLPASPVSPPFPSVSGPVSGEVIQKRPGAPAEMDPARVEAVREAVQAGMAQGAILEQVWAVKAGGGAAYKAATDEFRAILAYLVGR